MGVEGGALLYDLLKFRKTEYPVFSARQVDKYASHQPSSFSHSYFSSDVFAMEMFRGLLYVILEHDGLMARERIGNSKVNDGKSQHIAITLKNWGAAISVS